jgi:hypothetical protein
MIRRILGSRLLSLFLYALPLRDETNRFFLDLGLGWSATSMHQDTGSVPP